MAAVNVFTVAHYKAWLEFIEYDGMPKEAPLSREEKDWADTRATVTTR